jgi:hypothetical protein
MDIKIDKDALREIVSAAILEKMSQEQRDLLIQQALASLLQAPPDSYGKKQPTKMEDLFREATYGAARDIVKEILASDTALKEKLAVACRDALTRALNNDELVTSIASLFSQIFAKAAEARYR